MGEVVSGPKDVHKRVLRPTIFFFFLRKGQRSRVLGFLGVFALSFFLFVVVAFQRLNAVMTECCQKLPLYRLSLALIRSDWVRAMLVFLFSPAVPFVLILSFVNQRALSAHFEVPGVPVYIFAGIIIADNCPWGFEAGAGIAIGVGFVLKLLACAMQQKLIGERLGKLTFIRAQVGINQPMIRALEAVLRKPGLSLGKVSILCGGPDWPTSVLAGILRLSLLECEIGTLPIIFFVGACSLSGSFYLKQEESEVARGAFVVEIFDLPWSCGTSAGGTAVLLGFFHLLW
eukprot:g12849.t1